MTRRLLKILVAFLVGAGTISYGVFRIERASADVSRARTLATAICDAQEKLDADVKAVDALAGLLGLRGAGQAAKLVADIIERGDISKFEAVSRDARYCRAEVESAKSPIDLLFFSLPTPCKAMFMGLGEPVELADAGRTYGSTVRRIASPKSPGVPGGPACAEWLLEAVTFEVPKKKKNGNPWDALDAPDPFVEVSVGAGRTKRSGTEKNSVDYRWAAVISATPGQTLKVRAFDRDVVEHDFITGAEAKVPTHIPGRVWSVREFTWTVRCKR